MRSSDSEFKLKLDTGCEFEQEVVHPWLIDEFPECWVIEYHDNRIEERAGPRIRRKGERPLILPDFGVIHPRDPVLNMLVEAKYKEGFFTIPGRHGAFVAIEEFKCLQYQEVAYIMRTEFYIVIGVKQTNSFYLFSMEQAEHYVFNNKYASGPVKVFKLDEKYKIGDLP